MNRISTPVAAPAASNPLANPIGGGVTAPADHQRGERHRRAVAAGVVPTVQPKPIRL
jgi:hypothetical protein